MENAIIPVLTIKQGICSLNSFPRCELLFIEKFGYMDKNNCSFEMGRQKIIYNYLNKSGQELATYRSSLMYFLQLELNCYKAVSKVDLKNPLYKTVNIYLSDMKNFIDILNYAQKEWFAPDKLKEIYNINSEGFILKENLKIQSIYVRLKDAEVLIKPVTIYNKNDETLPGVRFTISDQRCETGVYCDISITNFNAMYWVLNKLDMANMAQSLEIKYGPLINDYKIIDKRINTTLGDNITNSTKKEDINSKLKSSTKISTRKKV